VVIPLLTQHYILLQRNLLYTAITRGKRLVIVVGSKKALAIAVKNDKTQKRFTWLRNRMRNDYSLIIHVPTIMQNREPLEPSSTYPSGEKASRIFVPCPSIPLITVVFGRPSLYISALSPPLLMSVYVSYDLECATDRKRGDEAMRVKEGLNERCGLYLGGRCLQRCRRTGYVGILFLIP
jgi:hypothetical protein